MSRTLIMLSGGIDSAVTLAWAHRHQDPLLALSFQYFLRPVRERLAVFRLLEKYPAKFIEIPLPFLKEVTDFDRDTGNDFPEGYISNRNMIFYSIAAHYAELYGCDRIIGGHTIEDQEVFPDASPEFFGDLQKLIHHALLKGQIRIEMPLGKMTKLQVMQQACDWKVPFEDTWSCYWDGDHPCGTCVSCSERAEAFRRLGVSDPLCTT